MRLLSARKSNNAYDQLSELHFIIAEFVEIGLKDKKSWWRVSPSCFGGGLCGGGRARR